MNTKTLYTRILRNLGIFAQFKKDGFDYILNPKTGELHKAAHGSFFGAHNLAFADLGSFIGLVNLDAFPIHLNFDGTQVPLYDLNTGAFIDNFPVNKCRHCFPKLL